VSLLPLLAWAWWTWPTLFDPLAPASIGRTPGRALDVIFVLGVGAVGAYLSRVWAASRTGPLLAVYAWLCFLDDLDFAHGSWLGVLGQLSKTAGGVLFLLIVLAYPAAWVRRRSERVLVAAFGLLIFGVGGVVKLLLLDTEDRLCGQGCPPDGNPLNLVDGAEFFVRWIVPFLIAGQLVTIVVALVLLGRRVRAATRRGRAVLLPLVLPWSLGLAVLLPLSVYDLVDILRTAVLGGGDWLPSVEGFARVALAVNAVVLGFVPVGYFIGMRRLLRRRRRLSELALPRSGDALEESVRTVLDDPQVRLVPGDDGPAGPGQTPLVSAGVRVGTLRHDPALKAEPGLLKAATALLALALAQHQLTDRLAGELAQARASRERLLKEERQVKRRIERDLHDGAQQRLVAVQAALGLFEGRQAQVAATEVAAAVSALRVLARGLAPPALELGLVPALTALGDRAPVPLRVTGCADGVPSSAADAAYDVLALLVDSATTQRQVAVDVHVEEGDLRLTVSPPLRMAQGVRDLLDAEGGRYEEREDAVDLVLPGGRILVSTP
jgi:signal transduction histidine kinase